MALITLISVGISFTETFVLGLFHSDDKVGLYAAALRLALIINFIIIAFNTILAPKFSALYRQQRLSEIQRLARQSILLMSALTLPLVLLYISFPALLLSLFGSDFASASPALMILGIGQMVNVASGPVGILLQMSGQERAYRNNVLITSFATIGSALLLIPPYAVTGAALSATFGILLLNGLSLLSVRKGLGIHLLSVNISLKHSRLKP